MTSPSLHLSATVKDPHYEVTESNFDAFRRELDGLSGSDLSGFLIWSGVERNPENSVRVQAEGWEGGRGARGMVVVVSGLKETAVRGVFVQLKRLMDRYVEEAERAEAEAAAAQAREQPRRSLSVSALGVGAELSGPAAPPKPSSPPTAQPEPSWWRRNRDALIVATVATVLGTVLATIVLVATGVI